MRDAQGVQALAGQPSQIGQIFARPVRHKMHRRRAVVSAKSRAYLGTDFKSLRANARAQPDQSVCRCAGRGAINKCFFFDSYKRLLHKR